MNQQYFEQHLTLSSERMNIVQVAPFLRGLALEEILGSSRYNDLLVAVTEAVNNGIIHGNGCRPELHVQLDVRIGNAEVLLIIQDEGPGFEADNVADPRSPDRIMVDGGRGVFLIRQLSDSSEFKRTAHGMAVLIKYYRQ